MNSDNLISQPFTLNNGVIIKNRIVKSAMSEAMAKRDGIPTPELVTLYNTWADGGVGLCITGNVMIDGRALGEPGNVIIEDESPMEALQAWAQAATHNNTQCWVQLNHPGKQAPKGLNKETVSPSAIPFRKDMQAFFPTPRALTHAEILELIERFATAAAVVKKAGFTGVQIHGAHGYLVSQFLSPHHNQRTDEWGGSPENRRRFVLDVYTAMREKTGPEFPIGIKLNSADFQRGGFTEEESLDTIRVLADAGIDLIEISGGTYEAPAMTGIKSAEMEVKESTRQREAYFLEFAAKVRQEVKIPLVVTGGFRTFKGMSEALASGATDFIGIARLMAVEPDAPNKLLAGQDPAQMIRQIKTGISMIDKMGVMETTFYAAQLKKMGKGNPPEPGASPLWVFLKFLSHQLFPGGKRKPTKLRAS